jgi:putative phosphoesterase
MPTRLGLISDIHSSIAPLDEALSIFKKKQVDFIICAGDIAGYGEDELTETVQRLKENNCYVIAGNHDVPPSLEKQSDIELDSFFLSLPKHLDLKFNDKRIYVVHASPPDQLHGGIKLLDQAGELINHKVKKWQKELASFEYDILIIGHTHQVFSEYLNKTLVINPGSTAYNNSCMILTLPDMTVSTYALQNKEIIKSWNWGLFYKEDRQ